MIRLDSLRRGCVLAAALFALAPVAAAGPYSDLIVFGDSLSDVGNTAYWTAGVFPGADYYQGRFSNGPVYSEHLSAGLGLGVLTRDGVGGDDFAYGGAETDGPGGFSGLFLNSLVEQVDAYLDRLGGSEADPNALFVVFIGANDLLGGQTNVATPAGVVQSQIERLVGVGARQLLGINLPLLGLTPDYLGGSSAAAISATTRDYNNALSGVYDTIETAHTGVTFHRLDLAQTFSEMIDQAASLGFTNTTDKGQQAAGGDLDGAPGYVFWDGVHPTREAHALLGEAALRAVLPAGDYNRNGEVDQGDYAVWRDSYGARFDASLGLTTGLQADGNGDGRVDAADFTVWRDAWQAASAAIPEPATGAALTALLFGYVCGRRRS
ncbi:Phosphatidylcholine-sterol acyltransferase precursor [Pseudobythopirellula maris]|uniref:Phosphatidylcholine-sterol acyltransferase n=1 Tax=Pseudobythopirellula maris TaxID=2527991 RepID=A0A5C5ZS98_9BACT|nr:SGNH/GDSL hydrolase family protein [Pseudobythopirellula maris]TWT90414.1 Phosphatidylcholine-sterol acyltransferase precursor [Pseudobythopirellula maris]